MKLEAFDFVLPEDLIAQNPVVPRDSSKMLVYDSATDQIFDKHFRDLPSVLSSKDVLVLNRSKVRDARILFKVNGSVKEIFVLRKVEVDFYRCMVRPGKWFSVGRKGEIKGLKFEVKSVLDDGTRLILFNSEKGVEKMLAEVGNVPLPPYIKHSQASDDQYQTVYADNLGSVAAPTAGLHFTEELFEKLDVAGVKREKVTLHVGRGTFLPVSSGDIEDHEMHSERYEFTKDSADKLNGYLKEGKDVVAVGTTSVRVLESNFKDNGFQEGFGETDIFIYPGYEWKAVNKLITNFHLPKSTLLMLVSSFLESKGCEDGVKKVMEIYEHAMKNEYRFYSFGDGMIIK